MRTEISTYVVNGEEGCPDSVKWTVEMIGDTRHGNLCAEFARAGKALEGVLAGLREAGFRHEKQGPERQV